MKHIFKNILTTTISTLIICLLIECVLRFFIPQIHQHDILFQPDATLGWTFIPNKKGAIVYPGGVNQYIQINESGFRDGRDFLQTKAAKKVMVIGDSFVTNVAVKDTSVFTEVMEAQGNDIAVLNFGVNGYGQVQEYLLLEQWLPEVQPDLVIQVVYLRNDFRDNTQADNWLYIKPTAVLSDSGRVTIQEIDKKTAAQPKKTTELSGYKKWHLYHFIRNRLGNMTARLDKGNTKYTPPEVYLCNPILGSGVADQYALLQALLLKTKLRIDSAGIPILFVLAPSIAQVQDESWQEVIDYDSSSSLQRNLPNQKLMAFARENQLLMLDLLPELQEISKEDEALYNAFEQHWTARGNEVVAGLIMDFIREQKALQ